MSSPGASILCNQTSAFPQPPKDGMRPMVINTNTEQKECIQRAWVARLKNRGMFDRVEEEFKWTIDPDVTPCYWGDDWIIFLNLQDTKANQLLNEESTNGSTPILDLQKWSKDIRPTHRMAWVLLWGLLPHAWEPEYMGQVVSMASAPSPVTPCSLTLFVFPSRTSSHTHTASPSLPPSLPVSLPLSRSLPSLPLSRSLPSLPLIFKLKLIYKTSKTGLPIIWSIRLSKLMHI